MHSPNWQRLQVGMLLSVPGCSSPFPLARAGLIPTLPAAGCSSLCLGLHELRVYTIRAGGVYFELGQVRPPGMIHVSPGKRRKARRSSQVRVVTRSSLAVKLTHLPPKMRLHGRFLLSLDLEITNTESHSAIRSIQCIIPHASNYRNISIHVRNCTYTSVHTPMHD